MIELVGFDGDDTLWHSEGYYQTVHDQFERLVGAYVDLADARLHERLLETEKRNIRLFGYGAKGMTLSMIETAIEITDARISATDVQELLRLGKEVLSHPVELLPGIREAVVEVARNFQVVLITKGDLFHQEAKVARSGLADLFHRIEIVSEKDEATYQRVLGEFSLAPVQFAMVGNSLRSDIEPVVALGGWGVYMPYHITWAHEMETGLAGEHPRYMDVAGPGEIPAALSLLQSRKG
ncbi:MAG: haloacid dehalogenase [Gammaproteobacteria bacterium RIFCSPHIGHO2_12_FULL_63_22]|nr:MAG: haloacid dehalogenase [Gammaproteobacteria bacterium RIFCSPHIGHO2_12_FULL_63_22]